MEELRIESFYISIIENGYIIRVSLVDDAQVVDDRWQEKKFFFETKDEVIAFLETNLD